MVTRREILGSAGAMGGVAFVGCSLIGSMGPLGAAPAQAQARRREAEARGKLFGLGFANYVESSIGSPKERADIIVHSDKGIEVVIGTQPAGQGQPRPR